MRANTHRAGARTGLAALALLLWLSLTPAALAAPTHSRLEAQDITGLNHACGAAVDSQGDVYAASAGESKVKIYSPAHVFLASIEDTHDPCGLAVDSHGRLYVSEKATGKVVQYTPNAYPLTASPSYSSPVTIDSTGNARGISVDQSDDRLYVAEGNRVASFQADGTTGQDEVQQVLVPQAVSGSFKLKFEGQETAPLTVVPGAEPKPTNVEIQTALEALPTIGAGNVAVAEGGLGVRSHRVAFTHARGSKDVPKLEVDSSGLTDGAVFVNELVTGSAFSGLVGEGELGEAVAVAAFTYDPGADSSNPGQFARHYVFVSDAATDTIEVFTGQAIASLKASGQIDGKSVPDSEACPTCAEGFGPLGAGLAVDWASGHLFVYDDAHKVLDEFEADGEYLDQVHSASFTDAEPNGVAVLPQRSELQELRVLEATTGGSFKLGFGGQSTAALAFNATPAQVEGALEALSSVGAGNVSVLGRAVAGGNEGEYQIAFGGALANRDVAKLTVDDTGLTGGALSAFLNTLNQGYGPGRVYVSSGAGPGAKLLAFGPLAEPSRAPLPSLSHVLVTARAVATDSHGDVYAAAGAKIHVYAPDGEELLRTEGASKVPLIEDAKEAIDLDVDSTGKVYVLDAKPEAVEGQVTYYTPSSYPPTATTTYTRHEPALVTRSDFPPGGGTLDGIGVNPGNDHLYVTNNNTFELGSAAEGSPILDEEVAAGLPIDTRTDVAVRAANGYLYVSTASGGTPVFWVVDPSKGAHGEVVARISGVGSGPTGRLPGSAIAVDQENGHVVTFDSMGAGGAAQEYDAAGGFVASFGEFTATISRPTRIALDNGPTSPNRGNLYIAFDDTKAGSADVTAFGSLAYGEAPITKTGGASGLGGGNATLNGTVDPRGFALADCSFQYTSEADFEAHGFAGSEAEEAPCVPGKAEIPKGPGAVAVHAEVSGLDPEGRYRFRLHAASSFGESDGKAVLFGAPLISQVKAQPVLYREANLRGTIDPSGVATKYHFEYGPTAAYGQSTPVGEIVAGAGATAVQAQAGGLEEGATYHFRLVAENEAGAVEGEDHGFETQERIAQSCANAAYRTGASADLPDCRAYELVTPAETKGASIVAPFAGSSALGINGWLTPPRGVGAGEALTYYAEPTLPGFEGSGVSDGYRAERAAGAHPPTGWTSEILSPSYVQGGGFGSEWRGGSVDQRYSFWRTSPQLPLEGALSAGIYLHIPGTDPPSACDSAPQPHFEPVGCGSLGSDPKAVPQFVSAAGAHVIFSSKAHLEAEAPPVGTEAVYDRAAGATSAQILSTKPGGGAFGAGENASYVAASEDGAAVVFKAGGNLYLHRGGQSFKIASSPNSFAGISEDGKRVFYAAGAGDKAAQLFACDVEAGPCVGEGEAGLTEIVNAGIFVNVSPDGFHAFFSSEEVLTGSEENDAGEVAQAAKPNLYVWSGGTMHFVAVLDPQDFEEFGGNAEIDLGRWSEALTAGTTAGRGFAPTRSTPNGGAFVFQSHAQIGAYPNEGEGEIYRYEPSGEAGQRLICISCDPSGAAPEGDAMLEEMPFKIFARPMDRKAMITNLTDDGREAFFQSPDRLLPGDANDAIDVYEWEAAGTGGCRRAAGCLALISSGQGEGNSYLYSTSADGRDVFIHTSDKLVSADVAGSPSIYDARVEGGIPGESVTQPCHGDACQGQGSSPPVLPSEATTGAGEGNEAPARPPACAKGGHRVKGRCVAAKKHHRRRHRRAKAKRGVGQ